MAIILLDLKEKPPIKSLATFSPQAITWDSHTGRAVLYDNGRPVWRVYRSKGATIPSGGTLVMGREQVDGSLKVVGSRPDRITSRTLFHA